MPSPIPLKWPTEQPTTQDIYKAMFYLARNDVIYMLVYEGANVFSNNQIKRASEKIQRTGKKLP